MGPERSAPAVVAVVVACGHGIWLDEALSSLAAQDYPGLSVLVVEVGADDSVAGRVAELLPDAHFARLPPGTTFAQAANRAVDMIDGVAHVLVCHDDVALAPDAVRLLLEEAYRSNAGLTCPKFVSWDDPDRLLSVGMGADHLGVAYPLVERGELDQGQHDAAREVFVAPGGAVLVRTDLWQALGGFASTPAASGEDLDLSWRAHLLGARVVVAPQARVRHLEAGGKGLRRARAKSPAKAERKNKAAPDAQRLRVLWTCYGPASLVLVAPVAVLFVCAESLWGLFHPRRGRGVVAPLRSLARSLIRPGAMLETRRKVQKTRRVSDLAIWKAQSRGSARLRALVRPGLERGYELAWAASRVNGVNGVAGDGHPTGSWDMADLNGSGLTGHGAAATTVAAPNWRGNWRVTAALAVAVVVLLLIGSRDVLAQPLPLVGQLPSAVGGVTSWWHAWWAGTGPGPLASLSFAPPGLLFMGLIGGLSFGDITVAVHLLVLVPLALGPLGVYLATRELGSQKARAAATVLYAALPVPYNALSQGHWAGLIGFAASPWVLASLGRASGEAPFQLAPWRSNWTRFISLGLLVAVAASLAPAVFLLVPIAGIGLFAGSLLTGRRVGGAKLLLTSVIATAIGFAALLPWSLGAFRSAESFFALTSTGPGALSVSSVFRLDTGPFGGGVLGWAFVAAAALPLFIGRSWRLAWAARLWVVAFAFFGLAWAGSRGWLPVPPLELVLAPAGAALAFSVALGATSVEMDLPGYRFGWRQFAPAFGVVAVVAAALPFLAWVGGGMWDLPASAAESAYAFPAGSPGGDYRVLWIGSQGSLPLAGQGSSDGLAFATTLDGLPSAGEQWAPVSPGRAPIVAQDLAWAENRETTDLGRLFAPLAIRYVVVPVGRGPAGAAEDRVAAALARQVDLYPVGTDPGYRVFANSSWAPLFSVLAARYDLSTGPARPEQRVVASKLQGMELVARQAIPLNGSANPSFALPTRSSPEELYGAVQEGSWRLDANGHVLAADKALGWSSSWELPAGTIAIGLTQRGATGQHVADIVMVLVWGLVLLIGLLHLRAKVRSRLDRAGMEFPAMGNDFAEIDLSSVWEEESVG